MAVCIKKEFHTIAVADCPISDNEWVSYTKYSKSNGYSTK